jgi:hypothetical protein
VNLNKTSRSKSDTKTIMPVPTAAACSIHAHARCPETQSRLLHCEYGTSCWERETKWSSLPDASRALQKSTGENKQKEKTALPAFPSLFLMNVLFPLGKTLKHLSS